MGPELESALRPAGCDAGFYIRFRTPRLAEIMHKIPDLHAFMIRHPGKTKFIGDDKDAFAGCGAPAIDPPQIEKQDRPKVDRNPLVVWPVKAMDEHGGKGSRPRNPSD